MLRPRPSAPFSRRQLLTGVGVVLAGMYERLANAADAMVPLDLQAKLTAKVALYDRNLEARAGAEVLTLLVAVRGNADSERAANHLQTAFQGISTLAGKPHKATVYWYQNAAKLATECRSRRAAIVYITPGFAAELSAIGTQLAGVDVLSVGVDPDAVTAGVVVGFKLVGAKPKVRVNLAQAKRQNVALSSALLQLAEVVA